MALRSQVLELVQLQADGGPFAGPPRACHECIHKIGGWIDDCGESVAAGEVRPIMEACAYCRGQFSRPPRRECSQAVCRRPAAYQYEWPGRDETLLCCERCSAMVHNVGRACGLFIRLRPLGEHQELGPDS